MISIAEQTLNYVLQNNTKPTLSNLNIKNTKLLESKAKIFVTLYKNGEVRGGSGNIQEISGNTAEEIIENTYAAMVSDPRFDPITPNEASNIKIRIDRITDRQPLSLWEYKTLDPLQYGILVVEKEYKSLAVILPNMSSQLLTGDDFLPVLAEKLKIARFDEDKYIIYSLQTSQETNY